MRGCGSRVAWAPAARQPNGWAVEHRGSAEAALHQGLDDEPRALRLRQPSGMGACGAVAKRLGGEVAT